MLRFLLFPFSLIYGAAVWLRNRLYDHGFLKSRGFELPTIVVGNLEVGGSGKTPLTEYLARLLKDDLRVAILSRGYGRRTRGFIRAEGPGMSAGVIGDEPFQYYSKFRDVTVAVGEDRVAAVQRLREDQDVILLDDAFQHRRLRPGFSILVFDYNTLFRPRLLLPAGNYREPFGARKRADVLLVSKTPETLSGEERERIVRRLRPFPGQLVCFSFLRYGALRSVGLSPRPVDPSLRPADPSLRTDHPDLLLPGDPLAPADLPQAAGRPSFPRLDAETHVLLLTGIARPEPLAAHVRSVTPHVWHLKYPDHHSFTVKNIAKIAALFEGMDSDNKLILTTEKDAARLGPAVREGKLRDLPVFYWPVDAEIHEPERGQFHNTILKYVRRDQAGS